VVTTVATMPVAGTDRPDGPLEVIAALTSLIRASRAVARQRHDQLGASGTPVAVLKALSRATDGQNRPGDLAVAAGVAPSVVSRVLPRLEEDGLVTRVRDEHDARSCHILLTDAGREQLAAIQREYAAALGAALEGVPEDEVARMPATLAHLEQALLRAAEGGVPRHSGLAPSLRPRHTPAPEAGSSHTRTTQTSHAQPATESQ
jgi:DNA-binding MarR family transcriptional regulator